jgi:CheY-like chemotaxis protein
MRAAIVSGEDLAAELQCTVLYRGSVERVRAADGAQLVRLAAAGELDVIVIDAAFPGAAALVAALRQDASTRAIPIVALGRSEFSVEQLDVLQAGANAILPLSDAGSWDDRLLRLLHVPLRRATRLAVALEVEGGARGGQRFEGRALNLSVNGLLLECPHALEVGDDVRFACQLPAGRGQVSATGTVVRVHPPHGYGVEITSVEGDGRLRIRSYVESSAGAE